MKCKFLKAVIAGLTLSGSSFANATLLTLNGYTLDTETSIVSKGNIEYLQWSVTTSNSIESALNLYADDGWSLVSNLLMSEIFTDFGFNSTNNENESVTTKGNYTSDTDTTNYDHFIQLFGLTFTWAGTDGMGLGVDGFERTSALFGADMDGDGFYNSASVSSDYTSYSTELESSAELSADGNHNHTKASRDLVGIALMRIQVPEPSTLAIFALGIVGLASRRFKRQS